MRKIGIFHSIASNQISQDLAQHAVSECLKLLDDDPVVHSFLTGEITLKNADYLDQTQ